MTRVRGLLLWLLCLGVGGALGAVALWANGRSAGDAAGAGGRPVPALQLSPTTSTPDGGWSHPDVLTNASEEEVGQHALAQVQEDFVVRGGAPRVLLARRVTRDDLPALNLRHIPKVTIEDPPLMLVIIKGDFGPPTRRAARAGVGVVPDGPPERYTHVGYVYDLWAGSPTLTMASPNGGIFRTALNDPSLPIVPAPSGPPPGNTPIPRRHYGEMVPGIAPNTTPIPPVAPQPRQ